MKLCLCCIYFGQIFSESFFLYLILNFSLLRCFSFFFLVLSFTSFSFHASALLKYYSDLSVFPSLDRLQKIEGVIRRWQNFWKMDQLAVNHGKVKLLRNPNTLAVNGTSRENTSKAHRRLVRMALMPQRRHTFASHIVPFSKTWECASKCMPFSCWNFYTVNSWKGAFSFLSNLYVLLWCRELSPFLSCLIVI